MSDLATCIANLSPAQRALLASQLKVGAGKFSIFQTSFAQQRLWFIDQLEPGSPLYNLPVVLRLRGRLNVAALEQSLSLIIERHEVLRTIFLDLDGQPMQVITSARPAELRIADLAGLSEEKRAALPQELASGEARRPFNLATGPLLRVTLLRLDEQDHVALLTMHHIVSDGWSLKLLMREVATLYGRFATGEVASLSELRIQYADFANWQKESLQGKALEAQLGYWKDQLADAAPTLELPTDRPRRAMQSYRGATESLVISPALTEKLKMISRQEGATLFITLLASFQTLLMRYTGQRDILVGTPVAGRNRTELNELIGFFVNTLVIRTDLSGNPSFRQLVGKVREVMLEAQAHQDLPFERLVEELHAERSLSHTPVFQVMFTLQNAPDERFELPRLEISYLGVDSEVSKFDLGLIVVESENTLVCLLNYNSDLFDSSTIARVLRGFEALLTEAASDPSRPLSSLASLTEEERHLLENEWNDSEETYPRNLLISHLVEQQAELHPDAAAIVFEDEQLTYRELNHRANQLANYLKSLGVRPETRVGVLVERSLELVIGLLAIFKSGGAYVPLAPASPNTRLRFMLEDSQISILITQNRLLSRIEGFRANVVCLDSDADIVSRQSGDNCAADVDPTYLAYMIYTSGSTGKPKAVMVEHGSLANVLLLSRDRFQPSEKSVMPAIAPFSFDISLFELFLPLLGGGKCLLLGREQVLDMKLLMSELNKVTFLHAVPSLMLEIVKHIRESDHRDHSFGNIETIFIGGDLVPPELLEEMKQVFPLSKIYVLYGPTEGTIICSGYAVHTQQKSGRHIIGRPLNNVKLRLCDEDEQPVPIGVPGEIYIEGAGVARGYLNRPELTEEKFPQVGGRRSYRTGDLACYLPDGNIEFLGRKDNQVKIRGYRIELGEIEQTLRTHPSVRDCVISVQEATSGDKRLVAYAVMTAEPVPDTSELRRFLQEKLPEYMVPSAFVTLDRFPLTPNGKLDRAALPAPQSEPTSDMSIEAARSPVEEVLAGIFAEVLGIERACVHDNFFDLGGHSLLATQLISRARDAFRLELSLRKLFENPTVAGLAAVIDETMRSGQGLRVPPISRAPRNGRIQLSFAQRRMWFLEQLEPGDPAYNVYFVLHLRGQLNLAALQQTMNEIVRRHEALRTSFVSVDGHPSQVIARTAFLEMRMADLRAVPEDERDRLARDLAAEEVLRTVELSRSPLLRMGIVSLGAGYHVVLFTTHHIVSDGWSIGVLSREAGALYEAYSSGSPSPLEEIPIQYADFAQWQSEWLKGEMLQEQLAYWKKQLSGAPLVLQLPTDSPRSEVFAFQGITRFKLLSRELAESLKAFSRQQRATLFMTLLAGFKVLLYRYCGRPNIVVGTGTANRSRPETERLIGFFVNMLVLHTDLSGNPTFRELLGRVREVTLNAYAHQDIPFEKLVEELRPERRLAHTPLFQVVFLLQNNPVPQLRLPGLSVRMEAIDAQTAHFDLYMSMTDSEQGLGASLQYNSNLFKSDTINRMFEHFEAILEAAMSDPECRILDIPLTDREQASPCPASESLQGALGNDQFVF